VQERHPFTVIAYVILPDHLHMIWELPENDSDFPTRWRLIKSYVSRKIFNRPRVENQSRISKGEQGIWQRRYWEHTCRNQHDLDNHIGYIHYNPVKHGYVKTPYQWKRSSFAQYVEEGLYPVDWFADNKPELKLQNEWE
jgi:putative transposase